MSLHVSCGKCGRTVVPGPDEPRPYGLCIACMVKDRYEAKRRFDRATSRWILRARRNLLRYEGDPFE